MTLQSRSIGRFLLLGTLALKLAGASSLTLQSPEETNFTLEGKVTQHSAGKLTVSTGENILFHVRYGEKTVIKRPDGSSGSAQDVRVGLRIKVEGELTQSGEIVAQKIEIQKSRD